MPPRPIWIRIFVVLLPLIVLMNGGSLIVYAGEVEQGDTVTIVTPGVTARLCPQPMCGPEQHILRIPEGTDLKVEGIEDVKIGTILVTWFQVIVEGDTGWISIYDTNKAP
jgi:hypothetical protein